MNSPQSLARYVYAALIDAHDLAENERGGGGDPGPPVREERAALPSYRGKKPLEYQAKRETRVQRAKPAVVDWNAEGADHGCDFTRLR